jgi:hypothetical protein
VVEVGHPDDDQVIIGGAPCPLSLVAPMIVDVTPGRLITQFCSLSRLRNSGLSVAATLGRRPSPRACKPSRVYLVPHRARHNPEALYGHWFE